MVGVALIAVTNDAAPVCVSGAYKVESVFIIYANWKVQYTSSEMVLQVLQVASALNINRGIRLNEIAAVRDE